MAGTRARARRTRAQHGHDTGDAGIERAEAQRDHRGGPDRRDQQRTDVDDVDPTASPLRDRAEATDTGRGSEARNPCFSRFAPLGDAATAQWIGRRGLASCRSPSGRGGRARAWAGTADGRGTRSRCTWRGGTEACPRSFPRTALGADHPGEDVAYPRVRCVNGDHRGGAEEWTMARAAGGGDAWARHTRPRTGLKRRTRVEADAEALASLALPTLGDAATAPWQGDGG